MARFSRTLFLPSFFYLTAAVIGILCLLIALYAQHVLDMAPCAWCVLQRLILLISCCLAVIAFITYQIGLFKTSWLIGFIFVLSTLSGIAAAWHQYTVASAQFSCSLSFADKTITQLGLDQALPQLFGIHAQCIDAKVKLLGIDFALWSLNMFIVLTAGGITALWMYHRQASR